MLEWWDQACFADRRCFLIMVTRVQGGMPVEEAGRRFRLEVAGQTDPDCWRLVLA